jgi:hypothetical protein
MVRSGFIKARPGVWAMVSGATNTATVESPSKGSAGLVIGRGKELVRFLL